MAAVPLTRGQGAWLVAIVAAGAVLRFVPIWFGLPFLRARPDEQIAVGVALSALGGDPNPHFFHWPSLTFYVFAALFAAVSWVRGASAPDPLLTDVEWTLVARGLVALVGTATLVAVFRIGRSVGGAAAGLLAALFLAVALLHVRDSHFAMTDVLTTFIVAVALALLLDAIETPDGRMLTGAAFVSGLAASTKYNAAALLAAVAAAHLLRRRVARRADSRDRGRWAEGLAALAAFGAGFLVGTPYAVLDFGKFHTDVRFTVAHLAGGHGADLGPGWSYHARRSLPYGLGIPTFAAAVAGIVPLARYYPRQALVLGAFTLALYASLGRGQTVFFRYILPLFPVACVSAAVAVMHAARWTAARFRLPARVPLYAITAALAIPAALNCVWFDVLLARTDTRLLAARWLQPRLRPESTLHDAGGEYTLLDLRGVRFHPWTFDSATRSFGHPEGKLPDWLVVHESPLRVYTPRRLEIEEIARSRYTLVRTFAGAPTTGGAVYDYQDAFFVPFSRFWTLPRPGPTIKIYRRAGE